jgi:hypothetical protein
MKSLVDVTTDRLSIECVRRRSVEDGIPTRERGNEVPRLWVIHRGRPWGCRVRRGAWLPIAIRRGSVEDGIPTRERGNEVVRLWAMHRALPWAGMFLTLLHEELTRNPALARIQRRTRVYAAIGRASRKNAHTPNPGGTATAPPTCQPTARRATTRRRDRGLPRTLP